MNDNTKNAPALPQEIEARLSGKVRGTCSAFLSACRAVAKKNGDWTDRACATFQHGGDWIEVRDYDDKIVWYGQAHCKYCARAEAILNHTPEAA